MVRFTQAQGPADDLENATMPRDQGVWGQGRRRLALEAGDGKLAVKGGEKFSCLGVPFLSQFVAAQAFRRPSRVVRRS